MNRLVLIGNGFDLAHGLKTSYADFINWYWSDMGSRLLQGISKTVSDELCSFTLNHGINVPNWASAFQGWYYTREQPWVPWDVNEVVSLAKRDKKLCEFKYNGEFFERINKSIESKGWVDIECEYYELLKEYLQEGDSIDRIEELNKQLRFLQDKLVEYLKSLEISDKMTMASIRQKIYAPFDPMDISVAGKYALGDHIGSGLELDDRGWDIKLYHYGLDVSSRGYIDDYRNDNLLNVEKPPMEFYLPNQIMLLNFNYTSTALKYCKDFPIFSVNQIHGILEKSESVIFGYGDELDEDYKKISNRNDNSLLTNIKSIKYLESDNYRKMLSFIESEPYQIFIMGHSCGNSDRTLLNTLFEHKNCVSIKPYYYKKDDGSDNYLELIQNISRNFTNMKLMRDLVVNKLYCEPLT